MKIGDEVFIHGYVNEIRKDIVIIENKGGYFGTVEEEIIVPKVDDKALEQEPKTDTLDKIRAEIMSRDGLEEALEIIDKHKAETE